MMKGKRQGKVIKDDSSKHTILFEQQDTISVAKKDVNVAITQSGMKRDRRWWAL
jgi:predicted transcriptional regulator